MWRIDRWWVFLPVALVFSLVHVQAATTGIRALAFHVSRRTLTARSEPSVPPLFVAVKPNSLALSILLAGTIVMGPSQSALAVVDAAVVDASAAEWRQYVPLAVSVAVIVDIVCGSPVANGLLSVVRPAASQDTAASSTRQKTLDTVSSRERIDSVAVANAAIQKAKYTLELRQFLDERQTDADKYQALHRQMDEQTRQLQAQQASLSQQLNVPRRATEPNPTRDEPDPTT